MRGRILLVQLVNPPFLKGLQDEALEAKAREVATVARGAGSATPSFEKYEIVFVSQRSAGVTFSRARRFRFDGADLGGTERRP